MGIIVRWSIKYKRVVLPVCDQPDHTNRTGKGDIESLCNYANMFTLQWLNAQRPTVYRVLRPVRRYRAMYTVDWYAWMLIMFRIPARTTRSDISVVNDNWIMYILNELNIYVIMYYVLIIGKSSTCYSNHVKWRLI